MNYELTVALSFFVMGIFTLVLNTIKDLKTHKVDDRYNYYMFGVISIVMAVIKLPLWLFISLLAFIVLMNIALRFVKVGEGDISAYMWITLGLGLINVVALLLFWVVILFLQILLSKTLPQKTVVPFYVFILLTFVSTFVIWWVYL